ncbi:MAG: hypothetical protein ACI4KI_07450 [Candidatus Fimenecus sp.]
MKAKILKYNLIPMIAVFLVSMLYNIGFIFNVLMIEIKFKSGNYPYKSTGTNGRFFTELYGEEWSLGYMLWALIALAVITVITLLFYRKKFTRISFMLFGLSAVFGGFIGVFFVSQNIMLLTVGLAIEVAYLIFTVIFAVKDFRKFPI